MLERITRRSVFRRFAPPAPRYRSRILTLVVAPRAESEGHGAGLAMATSRRVGPAVVRNRLRRQIRAVSIELDRERPWSPGWYLVIVHPSARGRSSAELGSALADVLHRAGVRP
ncbi:MAG TPA: ribonuclease P protein component [Microthrixaceae bacterium]|nr:ribonuclease P protein component [Microthrixaceae bacterium]